MRTASYVTRLRQIKPHANNLYMIYSQKIFHVRLPLALLREMIGSSLSTAVEIAARTRRKGPIRGDKLHKKHYAFVSLA